MLPNQSVTMTKVVHDLKGESERRRYNALVYLRKRFLKEPDGYIRLHKRQGLEPLVSLITTHNELHLNVVLSILGNCCTNDMCKAQLLGLGMLDSIGKVLARTDLSYSVRNRAARIIGNVALDDKGVQLIYAHHATLVPLVVDLLDGVSITDEQELRQTYCRTVRLLAATKEHVEKLIGMEAVKPLAECLQSDNTHTVIAAFKTLAVFTDSLNAEMARQLLLGDTHVTLVRMLGYHLPKSTVSLLSPSMPPPCTEDKSSSSTAPPQTDTAQECTNPLGISSSHSTATHASAPQVKANVKPAKVYCDATKQSAHRFFSLLLKSSDMRAAFGSVGLIAYLTKCVRDEIIHESHGKTVAVIATNVEQCVSNTAENSTAISGLNSSKVVCSADANDAGLKDTDNMSSTSNSEKHSRLAKQKSSNSSTEDSPGNAKEHKLDDSGGSIKAAGFLCGIFKSVLSCQQISILMQHLNTLALCCQDSVNRRRMRQNNTLPMLIIALQDSRFERVHNRLISSLLCFMYDNTGFVTLIHAGMVGTLLKHLGRVVEQQRRESAVKSKSDTSKVSHSENNVRLTSQVTAFAAAGKHDVTSLLNADSLQSNRTDKDEVKKAEATVNEHKKRIKSSNLASEDCASAKDAAPHGTEDAQEDEEMIEISNRTEQRSTSDDGENDTDECLSQRSSYNNSPTTLLLADNKDVPITKRYLYKICRAFSVEIQPVLSEMSDTDNDENNDLSKRPKKYTKKQKHNPSAGTSSTSATGTSKHKPSPLVLDTTNYCTSASDATHSDASKNASTSTNLLSVSSLGHDESDVTSSRSNVTDISITSASAMAQISASSLDCSSMAHTSTPIGSFTVSDRIEKASNITGISNINSSSIAMTSSSAIDSSLHSENANDCDILTTADRHTAMTPPRPMRSISTPDPHNTSSSQDYSIHSPTYQAIASDSSSREAHSDYFFGPKSLKESREMMSPGSHASSPVYGGMSPPTLGGRSPGSGYGSPVYGYGSSPPCSGSYSPSSSFMSSPGSQGSISPPSQPFSSPSSLGSYSPISVSSYYSPSCSPGVMNSPPSGRSPNNKLMFPSSTGTPEYEFSPPASPGNSDNEPEDEEHRSVSVANSPHHSQFASADRRFTLKAVAISETANAPELPLTVAAEQRDHLQFDASEHQPKHSTSEPHNSSQHDLPSSSPSHLGTQPIGQSQPESQYSEHQSHSNASTVQIDVTHSNTEAESVRPSTCPDVPSAGSSNSQNAYISTTSSQPHTGLAPPPPHVLHHSDSQLSSTHSDSLPGSLSQRSSIRSDVSTVSLCVPGGDSTTGVTHVLLQMGNDYEYLPDESLGGYDSLMAISTASSSQLSGDTADFSVSVDSGGAVVGVGVAGGASTSTPSSAGISGSGGSSGDLAYNLHSAGYMNDPLGLSLGAMSPLLFTDDTSQHSSTAATGSSPRTAASPACSDTARYSSTTRPQQPTAPPQQETTEMQQTTTQPQQCIEQLQSSDSVNIPESCVPGCGDGQVFGSSIGDEAADSRGHGARVAENSATRRGSGTGTKRQFSDVGDDKDNDDDGDDVKRSTMPCPLHKRRHTSSGINFVDSIIQRSDDQRQRDKQNWEEILRNHSQLSHRNNPHRITEDNILKLLARVTYINEVHVPYHLSPYNKHCISALWDYLMGAHADYSPLQRAERLIIRIMSTTTPNWLTYAVLSYIPNMIDMKYRTLLHNTCTQESHSSRLVSNLLHNTLFIKLRIVYESYYGQQHVLSLLKSAERKERVAMAVTLPWVVKDYDLRKTALLKYGALDVCASALQDDTLPAKYALHSMGQLMSCHCNKTLFCTTNTNSPTVLPNVCEQGSTVVIEFDDGRQVQANRERLITSSGVFSAMLEGNFAESRQQVVKIRETDSEAFMFCMRFLHGSLASGCGELCGNPQQFCTHSEYCSVACVGLDTLLQCLLIADQFGLSNCQEYVSKSLVQLYMNMENLPVLLSFANQCNVSLLLDACLWFLFADFTGDGLQSQNACWEAVAELDKRLCDVVVERMKYLLRRDL